MNLETRVETLEHELKILKSEIEATLLEIQEQVLIHYYPTLRAEDSTPPQEIAKHVSSRSRSRQEPAPEPTKPTAEVGRPTDTGSVLMREISLNGDSHEGPEESPSFSRKLDGSGQMLAPSVLPKLTIWSKSAVERIGREEAIQLVESCTEEVGCTPAIKTFVLQLIEGYDADEPSPQADTATLMSVFLELNTILATAKDAQAQRPQQADTLILADTDG